MQNLGILNLARNLKPETRPVKRPFGNSNSAQQSSPPLQPSRRSSRLRELKQLEKEMNRCKDMVGKLRSKANQMAVALNMSNVANRDSLLGLEIKSDDDDVSRVAGMDNQGIVGFQLKVMREQDEGIEQLEETVMSTEHIALAVNEELGLQTRLIDDLDYHGMLLTLAYGEWRRTLLS